MIVCYVKFGAESQSFRFLIDFVRVRRIIDHEKYSDAKKQERNDDFFLVSRFTASSLTVRNIFVDILSVVDVFTIVARILCVSRCVILFIHDSG